MNTLGAVYLESVIRRFTTCKKLGDQTLSRVSSEELSYRPNAACNSMAMIVQHMAGNMLSRWSDFLTTDGEKPWRKRDREFEDQHLDKDAVLALWEKGWACFMSTLTSLTEDDLLKTITIRQEPLIVVDAINRQLVHYPAHVGQLICIAKELKGESFQSLSIPVGQSEQYRP